MNAVASGALQRAASMWLLTAVAGQWLFVYYIAAFYGPTAISGDYAAWDRNTNMTDGYVAGDAAGNAFFLAHVLAAAVLTFAGALQLVPQIRARAIAFHRWNGRLFMIAASGGALAGLYLEWVRGTGLRSPTGLSSAFGVTLNAALILAFAVFAWRAVRNRDISAHRLWATRLFLVVNGTWFMRVGFRAWMVLTGGAFGGSTFFTYWSFAAYLLPLAIYELYLRSKNATPPTQYAMTACLVVLTVVTGIGTIYTFTRNWGPLLQ
ncbi:MAG TPA: DUF2306 domain-containing protein [Steroidobacteraceae bacterium]|jgi:hypothetical protein|nr:DUF2306 domain-containing protein [Steroidobacteraceae bacterium]HJY41055.1 DUF2306 domain-containing protein [Steroidobacteraceae bacterium]